MRVEEPVNDDGPYLSALVAINQRRIKPFYSKHRIDDLVGRIAIKIGYHRPTGFSAAVTETHAERFTAGSSSRA